MNLIQATAYRLLRSAPIVKRIPSVRGAILIDKDWGPGNYPRTEEERLAAAKKYNLLPEEYEAYDPEKWDFSLGDYPQLPIMHRSDHDSDRAWDYPFHQHNYGDPLHANYSRYAWWTIELNQQDDFVPPSEVFWFLFWSFVFTVGLTNFFIRFERIIIFKPMHRVYPGTVHYHYPNSKIEMYEEHDHHHH